MLFWTAFALATAASTPDEVVRCSTAQSLVDLGWLQDRTADLDQPVTVALQRGRVVASAYTAGGKAVRHGTLPDLTADLLGAKIQDGQDGCWLWGRQPGVVGHLNGTEVTAWMTAKGLADGLGIALDDLSHASPPTAASPRMAATKAVIRYNLSQAPTVPERDTGNKGLAAMAPADIALPLLKACSPWQSGALVVFADDGIAMYCPAEDPKGVVAAMVKEANHGPFDSVTETDGTYDLGALRMFARFVTAGDQGWWMGSSAAVVNDGRSPKGSPIAASLTQGGVQLTSAEATTTVTADGPLAKVSMTLTDPKALLTLMGRTQGPRLRSLTPAAPSRERIAEVKEGCEAGDAEDCARRADALPRLAAANDWLIRHVTG